MSINNKINFNIIDNNINNNIINKINKIKINNYTLYRNIIIKKLIINISNIIKANYNYISFNNNNTKSNKKVIKLVTKHKRNINIITTKNEHSKTTKIISKLKLKNISCSIINLNNINNINNKINKHTLLMIINIINNENGTYYNIKQINNICNNKNILLHIDGTQLIGKLPININKNKFKSITLSSNKIYGPKNISLLYNNNNKIKNYKNISVKKLIGLNMIYNINNNTYKRNFKHIKHLHNNLIIFLKRNKNVSKLTNINTKIPHIINILINNNINIITIKIINNIKLSLTSNCRKKYINSNITKNNHNQLRIILNKYNNKIEILELIKKLKLI